MRHEKLDRLLDLLPPVEGFAGTGPHENGVKDKEETIKLIEEIREEIDYLQGLVSNCIAFGTGGV